MNTGSERTSYRIEVRRVRPFSRAGRRVPARWIRLGRTTVTLNPTEGVYVRLTLVVPRQASASLYASDIFVRSLPHSKGFARAGTGAATALRFRVA